MESKTFFGREREIESLNNIWHLNNAQLVFVRGRRRVGKSRLLKQFAQISDQPQKKVMIFPGRVDESDLLCRTRIARLFDELIGAENLSRFRRNLLTWDLIFGEIGKYARELAANGHIKLLLVFDEIQWLAKRHSGILGAFKEFWEEIHLHTPIMIVISGSSNRFFASQVDHAEGVLRGLRTVGDILVQPFSLPEVAHYYFPKWTHEQVALVYMFLGGVPYYLEQIVLNDNFLRSVNDSLFSSRSIFLNEIDSVLKIETTGKGALANVKRVLSALGQDGSTESQTAKTTGISQANVHEILGRLETFGFVTERPLLGVKRANKHDVRYYMDDFYLNSYFQIFLPAADAIHDNVKNGLLINKFIRSNNGYYIENFSGKAFELLIFHVLRAGIGNNDNRRANIFNILDLKNVSYEVGTFWKTGQTQIDIVVSCAEDRHIRLIEAKWKGGKIDTTEFNNLVLQLKNKPFDLPNKTWGISHYIAVSGGVSRSQNQSSNAPLICLEDLFGVPAGVVDS